MIPHKIQHELLVSDLLGSIVMTGGDNGQEKQVTHLGMCLTVCTGLEDRALG